TIGSRGMKKPLPELVFDRAHHGPQFLKVGLCGEGIDIEGPHGPTGDDEKDDRDVTARDLEPMVQPGERFDGQVHSLVTELESAGGEQVKRLVQVKAVG